MIFLIYIMISLAVYRITRFIVKDTFPPMKWLRERLSYDDGSYEKTYRWRRSPEWLADLITCPWCVSAYVAALFVWLTDITMKHGLPVPVLFAFAAWATAAWPILWENSRTDT